MSIEIDWNRLLEDSDELSESIRSFLDDQFQKLPLPPYIKSLAVTSFSLGTVPPNITIKHISDPFPEFYSEDYDSDNSDSSLQQQPQEFEGTSNAPPPTPRPPESVRSDSTSLPSYTTEPPNNGDFVPGTIFPHSSAPLSPNSALHYFHYPFGSNLLSTIRSPLYQSLQNLPTLGVPPIRPSSTPAQSTSENNTGRSSPDGPEPASRQNGDSSKDEDIQFFLDVAYKGDMKLGVAATLLLNYPSPSFVSLPMKLIVTGLEIHSMAVLTYISRKIHFSFICDVDGEGDAVTLAGHDRIDIIKDIKIESEIGDQEGQGPVLRNVGKVEKFLLERIRALARDELAWPGWITFEF
ncbi:hypothetical protein TRICI_006199 [Trichomonascus ciferrii]|uniref:Mitochondrial distribution and morphology protein 12 n=1 Tax=Trichomonascus ciferrii TaxID=44093 RepID=A0A642UM11_9ASCO|nr:hypothetical protein TRICI_006199 [Trichomonascus ciferrii]